MHISYFWPIGHSQVVVIQSVFGETQSVARALVKMVVERMSWAVGGPCHFY